MDSGRDSSALPRRARGGLGTPWQVQVSATALTVALLAALPGAAAPTPAPANGNGASDHATYDDIRREIERAGRTGEVGALRREVDRIDDHLETPSPTEVTACWQLMKATAFVELAREDEAYELLGLLVDTCPIWEALNNLGVLEAGAGRFSAAVQNLRLAVAEARKAGLGEEKVPQGNLREVLSQVERPSLILAGYVRECAETAAPRAACSAPPPSPPPPPTPPPPAPPPPEQSVDSDVTAVPPPTPLPETDEEEAVTETLDTGRPETAPEPTAGQTPDEAAVRQAIESWRLAWQEQRFDDYVAAYGPDFPPGSELGRVQWLECRRDRIVNKRSISVVVGDIEVIERGGGDLLALFPLTYQAELPSGDLFGDQTDKELVFRKLDDGWKIIEENMEEQRCP